MTWFRSSKSEADGNQPPDDAALVAAARANPRAFTLLYERYLQRIYRYCLLRLGSAGAAEDATSEIFLKALANIDRQSSGSFAAWLFRIAQRVVIDVYRATPPVTPLTEELSATLVDPDSLPEELVIAQAERELLRRALMSLPDEQRSVLELQLAGLPDAQIAELLDKSLGSIRMLRYRAVERLRLRLACADVTELPGGGSK